MEYIANEMSERFLNLASSVFKQIKKLNTNKMNGHVCMQLFRSVTSIGANYEEARGAESRSDFGHKMKIALKEARESCYWLQLIIKTEIDQSDEIKSLLKENREICDIIAKSIKTLKANETKKN